MEREGRESGPPLPPGPGGALPLLLSVALAGFVVTGFMTLGLVAEWVRPGGMGDPVNLLLLSLVMFPLAVLFGLAVDRNGFATLADGLTMRPARTSATFLALLFGIAAVLPLAELDNLMQEVFPVDAEERRAMVEMLAFGGWFPHFAKVSAIVAVAPLGEELVFRGIIQRWLRRSYGRFAGIAVSALLFAIVHVSLRALVPILALGLFLAWVTDRARSVIPAVATHAVFNAAPFVIAPAFGDVPGLTPTIDAAIEHVDPLPVVVSSLCCLVLLYAVWWATINPRTPDR